MKQFLYGIFWLIFLGILGYGFYFVFLKPAPSCYDKKQNGSEEGVDCGKACGNICLAPDLEPISVRGQVKAFPIGENVMDHMSFLVQVQNPNSDFAAKNFKYVLKVSGQEYSGDSFLFASDLKYIAFPNLEISSSSPETVNAEFQILKTDWVKEDDFRKPTVTKQSDSTRIFPDRIEISGKLVNGSPETLPKATIVAILFSAEGEMIGVSQTQAENIASGEAREFTVVHPFIPGVNASKTVVYIYPDKP